MMKNGLLAAGFVALAAIGAAGWLRSPSPVNAVTPYASTTVPAQSAAYPQPSVVTNDPAYTAGYRGGAVPCVQPGMNPDQSAADSQSGYTALPGYESSAYSQRSYYRRPVRVVARPAVQRPVIQQAFVEEEVVSSRRYHRPRSVKKSAAMVAGSAGVGAAIGALAGGGKGAGIGALVGGGGGFLYDRLTHNRPPGGF